MSLYGYPRPTGDIDFWIAADSANADLVVAALRDFGFDVPTLDASLIHTQRKTLRLGHPPVRIEVLCDISGVSFEDCYVRRREVPFDGVPVAVISLSDLRRNKAASGRDKDLVDLKRLPETE